VNGSSAPDLSRPGNGQEQSTFSICRHRLPCVEASKNDLRHIQFDVNLMFWRIWASRRSRPFPATASTKKPVVGIWANDNDPTAGGHLIGSRSFLFLSCFPGVSVGLAGVREEKAKARSGNGGAAAILASSAGRSTGMRGNPAIYTAGFPILELVLTSGTGSAPPEWIRGAVTSDSGPRRCGCHPDRQKRSSAGRNRRRAGP